MLRLIIEEELASILYPTQQTVSNNNIIIQMPGHEGLPGDVTEILQHLYHVSK